MLKTVLILLVVLSIALLLYLLYLSQKLLRQAQQQQARERRENPLSYRVHPKLAEELKKIEQLKQQRSGKNKPEADQ
ncbi:hypothetical protein [Acinetobacter sp. WZC-1]|uniref:hypothetical protein n=1 Tax=Acinetobacter sp. WZC-1 TaxID=3459034 RepID=UPI00403D9A81